MTVATEVVKVTLLVFSGALSDSVGEGTSTGSSSQVYFREQDLTSSDAVEKKRKGLESRAVQEADLSKGEGAGAQTVRKRLVFLLLSSHRYPPSLPHCPYTQRLPQKRGSAVPCARASRARPALAPRSPVAPVPVLLRCPCTASPPSCPVAARGHTAHWGTVAVTWRPWALSADTCACQHGPRPNRGLNIHSADPVLYEGVRTPCTQQWWPSQGAVGLAWQEIGSRYRDARVATPPQKTHLWRRWWLW